MIFFKKATNAHGGQTAAGALPPPAVSFMAEKTCHTAQQKLVNEENV